MSDGATATELRVAVELKKAEHTDGVVTQVVRYLEELAGQALAKNRPVRGRIISGRADEIEARQVASQKRFQIDWYCYAVSLDKRASSRPLTKTPRQLPT